MFNLFDVRDSDSHCPLSPTEEVVLDSAVAAEMASDEISAVLHEVPSTQPRFTPWRREPSPAVIVHEPFKREMDTEQTHRVSAFSAQASNFGTATEDLPVSGWTWAFANFSTATDRPNSSPRLPLSCSALLMIQ